MAITAYAGFTASPSNSANRNKTEALANLPLSGVQIFGEAVDSNDVNATFTWSWSVLQNRTGQTATIGNATSQNTTLDNISSTWGNVRVFLIATNATTGETSESNPLLAPDSSQAFYQITSTNKTLTLPALGARNWYVSIDHALQALENLAQPSGGIQSATVNNAGDLIITLEDNTTINAGTVQGSNGSNGVSVASASINAQDQLILTMSDSSTINAGALPSKQKHTFTGTVHSLNANAGSTALSFNPVKEEIIWGGFHATQNYDCVTISITVKDAGSPTNTANFYLFAMSEADWINGSSAGSHHVGSAISITQGSIANLPKFNTVNLSSQSISSGQVFGVSMGTTSNSAMHHVNISLILEDQ